MEKIQYKAMISSDWSECLSPNGPFDPIAFNYPGLSEDLNKIFKDYTGNKITLTAATQAIRRLLPDLLTVEQMDAYLDQGFRIYTGVPQLMERMARKGVLFMLNTTGTQGYFQRAIHKGLLPEVPLVAANPLIHFEGEENPGRYAHQVLEIEDKATNTAAVVRELGLPPDKVAVMGDSGGDGPHFHWAAKFGAFRVGSMTKASLKAFCESRGVTINEFWGLSYNPGEPRRLEDEMKIDFTKLGDVIEEALGL